MAESAVEEGGDDIDRLVQSFRGFDGFDFSLWLCGEQAQVRGGSVAN